MIKLVSLPEIADMLDIGITEVERLKKAHPDFPEPVAELGIGDVWDRGPVRRWAKRNKIFVVPEPDEVTFPIITEFKVGTTKDDNSDVARRLGLSGDAAEAFRYTGLTVTLTISVDKYGSATVTHFNGSALESHRIITD